MEIIQNRYGTDRVLTKLSHDRIRIMGESLFIRSADDGSGTLNMFDFEGGPCLNVGGKIDFMKSKWVIKSIEVEETDQENLASVILTVRLDY
jgi:hypothetical protein